MRQAITKGRFVRAAGRGLVFLLAALALVAGGAAGAVNAPRPNVLFLFSDDQRADTIAALGNSQIRTPNLDRLAKTGGRPLRAGGPS